MTSELAHLHWGSCLRNPFWLALPNIGYHNADNDLGISMGIIVGDPPCSHIELAASLCGSAEHGAPFEIIRRV